MSTQGLQNSTHLSGTNGLAALGRGQAAQNLKISQQEQKSSDCSFTSIELPGNGDTKQGYIWKHGRKKLRSTSSINSAMKKRPRVQSDWALYNCISQKGRTVPNSQELGSLLGTPLLYTLTIFNFLSVLTMLTLRECPGQDTSVKCPLKVGRVSQTSELENS